MASQPPCSARDVRGLGARGIFAGSDSYVRTYAHGARDRLWSLCSTPLALLKEAGWRDVTQSRGNWSVLPRFLFFCDGAMSNPHDDQLHRNATALAWQAREMCRMHDGCRVESLPIVIVNRAQKRVGTVCRLGRKQESLHRWTKVAESSAGCSISSVAIPQSFSLPSECARFGAAVAKNAYMAWIIKPSDKMHGAGIVHLSPQRAQLQWSAHCHEQVIAQEYVEPLPIEGGYKFDLRAFLLVIARGGDRPLRAFYHRGFARRSDTVYSPNSSSTNSHVTNAGTQTGTSQHFLSYGRVGRALSHEYGLPSTHMTETVPSQMKRLMEFHIRSLDVGTECTHPGVTAAGQPLSPSVGSFQMMAADFAMDPRGNVWLLEVNTSPHWGAYPTDDELTPSVYRSALELVLAVHEGTGPRAGARDDAGEPRCHAAWEPLHVDTLAQPPRAYNACQAVPAPSRDGRPFQLRPRVLTKLAKLCKSLG